MKVPWNHSLTNEEIDRFSRQLILQGFGPSGNFFCKISNIKILGQDKLKNSSVLIVGAGGLGCPVAIYLAAAGVNRIGIVDHDLIELNNIHRQILHDEKRVGQSKASSVKESILR